VLLEAGWNYILLLLFADWFLLLGWFAGVDVV
jgi:hypothetical protein